jgi:hypothetical protein
MRKYKLHISIILLILLTGCVNSKQYEGYIQVKIPDNRIGTVYIPEEWAFYEEDNWIYIKDINSSEIIAIEYIKSEGVQELNPYVAEYTEILKLRDLTGNSNNSNCYVFRYEVNGESLDLIRLSFASLADEDVTRVILFVFLDPNINEDIIIKISKSYNASGK